MQKAKLKSKTTSNRPARRRLRVQRVVRMPGPAISTVRSHLRRLRKLIDESSDPYEQRVAYAMETAIRWATIPTKGWGCMAKEAVLLAELLKKDVARTPNGPDQGRRANDSKNI